MEKNTALWDSLEKTDPKHTKTFQRPGGFSGTAINGTYILKRLTEAFGPVGLGWRFVIEEEKVMGGHTLSNGDQARLHVIRGHIDYRQDVRDEWASTGPQFGQTMLVSENRNGVWTDEEAPKKSITDCISKCAVQLGIAADVHLGLFDDNKYVNQRVQEETAAKAEKGTATKATPEAKAAAGAPAGGAPKPRSPSPSADDTEKARALFGEISGLLVNCETDAELTAMLKERDADVAYIKRVSEPGWHALEDKVNARYQAIKDAKPRAK